VRLCAGRRLLVAREDIGRELALCQLAFDAAITEQPLERRLEEPIVQLQHATDDMQHATDDMQHATDDMQHKRCTARPTSMADKTSRFIQLPWQPHGGGRSG
jgi:hypothetical protein